MLSPPSKFMLWSRCEWLLVPSSPVLLFCAQDSGTLPVHTVILLMNMNCNAIICIKPSDYLFVLSYTLPHRLNKHF